MEELWAFNEEIVARSIFASRIPVISAVGHEIDFTIADFVADKRAETPTAAAQMAVPDVFEYREYVKTLNDNLHKNLEWMLQHKEQILKGYDIQTFISMFENKTALWGMKTERLINEIYSAAAAKISECENNINSFKKSLDELNPMNIMERGYGAVLDRDGKLTGSISGFVPGDALTVVLPDGRACCEVKNVRRDI